VCDKTSDCENGADERNCSIDVISLCDKSQFRLEDKFVFFVFSFPILKGQLH
jgi:hypothetical protein